MNQRLTQEKDPDRKYNGRYASGMLVPIPEWLPSTLRKFRRETAMSPRAIADQVPRDHNGTKVSGNAISNLMNNDLSTKKTQLKVGATLLGHLTTIIRGKNSSATVKTSKTIVEPSLMLSLSELVTSYAGLADEDRATITLLINRLQPSKVTDPRIEAVEKLMDMAAKLEGDINKGATC